MSNWKRIRQSAWHPSVAHLRETEDHEACQPCFCLPASAGGASCNTAECVNRGCHMECEPSVCPCGEECKNQEIQRQALPNVECVNLGLPNSLSSYVLVDYLPMPVNSRTSGCSHRPAAAFRGAPAPAASRDQHALVDQSYKLICILHCYTGPQIAEFVR